VDTILTSEGGGALAYTLDALERVLVGKTVDGDLCLSVDS